MKEFIKIIKDYYELIKDDKNKLIPFYIIYFLIVIVEILIPIFVANITQSLTNSLIFASVMNVIMYGILSSMDNILCFLTRLIYQSFFRDNYITMYKKIVNKIYNFDVEDKKNISTGKLINNLTTDIVNIGEMADNILIIIFNSLKCIVFTFYFLKINIFLSIFVVIVDIIYIKKSNNLNNKIVNHLKNQINENDKLINLISQTILGLKDIQTLNFYDKINEKYNILYDSWKLEYNSRKKYERFKQTILKLFIVAVQIIIYLVSVYLIINKKMNIGTMLIIISYFESLISSSEKIMTSSQSIKEQNISINRINSLLEDNEEKNKNEKNIKNIKGKIEFKNVFFSYNEDKLLEYINFTIEPNKITAITGINGTGKTTIINLILRLYKPKKGKILLDNIDINDIDKKSYLKEISILNQETYLFNLSIRENFNLINNNIKRQEEICKFTGVSNFIEGLPNGYDTIIDENSNNLSGGQKRLLSLTRMLLKESKILILDEATSSLDKEKVEKFSKILEKLKENHTIIVITHKKEIIDIADETIVINKGKVKIKI